MDARLAGEIDIAGFRENAGLLLAHEINPSTEVED